MSSFADRSGLYQFIAYPLAHAGFDLLQADSAVRVKFLSALVLTEFRLFKGVLVPGELSQAVLALIPAICEFVRHCHKVVYDAKYGS